MRSMLSDYVQEIQPSGIRKFFDLAAGMEGVISLGVGEPDFITPWKVREACILSLEEGYTAYTANAGLLELREEICKYYSRSFNTHYNPETEVIVTVGGSQAMDLAFRATVNPGEEVLIVEPCFVSYAPLVKLIGGVPVSVPTYEKNGFKVTKQLLEKHVTKRTKSIMLCSPNNPTGTLLSKEEMIELCDFIKEHDLLLYTDEIYAELSYDENFTSFGEIEGMRERTIILSGFSKGFAMTGWRLGYILAPEELTSSMLKIHQYSMMCAPTMSQFAALEALKNSRHEVTEMIRSYRRRRNYFVATLNQIGLDCHMPGGAFYAFPSIKSTGLSSAEFAERLLMEHKVAVVPGSVFGECGEGYIRCSYATSMEQLQEALRRINEFVLSLEKEKIEVV